MPQNLWAVRLNNQARLDITLGSSLRISNLSLTESLSHPRGRTTVLLTFLNEETKFHEALPIGSLGPNHYDQFSCEVNLNRGQRYYLDVVGSNEVDILGYFYDDIGEDELPKKATVTKFLSKGELNSSSLFPKKTTGMKRDRDDEEVENLKGENAPPGRQQGKRGKKTTDDEGSEPAASTKKAAAKPLKKK